ncbi:MAG: tetratricopeptide repeat protein, partial [Pseudomonadota bacterium]
MTKSPRRLLFFLLLSLPVWVNANVLDRMIEDVRVSRTGDQATVQIALGCRMRLLEQQPDDGGTRLRIVLVMDNQCRNAAGGAMNEVSRPSGAGLADIDEVFFDTPGNGRGVVTLTFERPVGFVVSQQVTGGLTVAVDLGTSEFAATPPVSSSAATAQVDRQSATRPNTPRPLRLRPAESDSERYSLLLGVFQDAEIAAEGIPEAFRDFTTYTTEIPVGNRFWQGLHLGFFATEPEAQQAIAQLQSIYPDVWVVVVDKRQQTEAVANQVQPSETQILPEPAPAIEGANLETTTLASLMKAGKQSIVERQYQQAINAYTQVLSVEDNPHRRQAREFLGLAFERNGQLDHAKSEYQRYLNDYPNAPELARVQSRLNALSTIDQDIQATRQPEPQSGDVSPWNTYAGFAQYFRYNIEEIPNGLGQVDELSGITTYGNLNVERTGERFDLATRVNASYYYETVSDDGSVGNTGWVSHAYLDVMDKELGLEGRIGRQTRNGTGVLGRFDGLYLGYRFKPWVSFNAVLGRPVESPRFQYNDRRFFYGLSVNFESLLDGLDFTLFNHRQTVDGIEDRNAVGGEAHYSTNRWNVIAVTDYDLGYQTLNTALVSAHYRLGEETTINGFFDFGAQPYLTTQNA